MFDGAYVRLYVNGALAAARYTDGYTTLQQTARPVIIGNGTSPLSGRVDSVRLYKVALSASQVAVLAGTPD